MPVHELLEHQHPVPVRVPPTPRNLIRHSTPGVEPAKEGGHQVRPADIHDLRIVPWGVRSGAPFLFASPQLPEISFGIPPPESNLPKRVDIRFAPLTYTISGLSRGE